MKSTTTTTIETSERKSERERECVRGKNHFENSVQSINVT